MKSLLIFLIFTLGLAQQIIAQEPFKKPSIDSSTFSVKLSANPQMLSIDQQLILQMTLAYPSHFHPNINLIKRNLLTYSGLQEPPFTLIDDIALTPQDKEGMTTQQITFILSPQLSGKHFLTAGLIRFDSDSNKGKSIEIPSDVLTVNVTIPQADTHLKSLIEPPMPLSKKIPITLSQANKEKYLDNSFLLNEEAKKNILFFKNKSFPWLALIAACAALSVITLIRLSPSKILKEENEAEIKEKNEKQIKQELQTLSLTPPKDPAETKIFITHLDFLIRRYLLNTYAFPAFSMTKEELIHKTEKLQGLKASLKEAMRHILDKADQIKFANYNPNINDNEELIETAKELSKQDESSQLRAR